MNICIGANIDTRERRETHIEGRDTHIEGRDTHIEGRDTHIEDMCSYRRR